VKDFLRPEIRCQDAPGREQNGVFWSWHEIEGKRCWFVRAGSAMPPKSAFTWAKEEPIQEDVPAVPDKAKNRAEHSDAES
jgi:hypothetical protein